LARLAKFLPYIYFFVDVSVLVFALFGASFVFGQNQSNQQPQVAILVGVVGLWLIVSNATKLYRANLHNGFRPRMASYAKSYTLFLALFISLEYLIFDVTADFGNVLFLSILTFLVLDASINTILVCLISKYRRRKYNIKETLVAGAGESALRIASYLNSNPDFGFHISGFLQWNKEERMVDKDAVVGELKNFKEYLEHHPVDELVIALPYKASTRKRIKSIIKAAEFHGARISYVPDYQGVFGGRYRAVHDGTLDAVKVRQLPLDESLPLVAKAVFDLIFSATALFFLTPILLGLAILIKIDSPGPVFYRPVRTGARGKAFRVFKFRTMYENDSATNGKLSTVKDDPRITNLGRILRKYNLDELPQFLNVLLGDMSVVGPRPHRNFLNEQMKEQAKKYMLRYYFRPGITGWAQINGWRGPTETQEQIVQRTEHDLWYIKHWSLMLDLKIIWLTIFGSKVHQNAF